MKMDKTSWTYSTCNPSATSWRWRYKWWGPYLTRTNCPYVTKTYIQPYFYEKHSIIHKFSVQSSISELEAVRIFKLRAQKAYNGWYIQPFFLLFFCFFFLFFFLSLFIFFLSSSSYCFSFSLSLFSEHSMSFFLLFFFLSLFLP